MIYMKHIAIPQSLLNEKARLDLADITGMDEATLAQHNADRLTNDTALSLVGDQPMTALEIADIEAQRAINAIESIASKLKADAQSALDKSDIVAIRCIKANVPFPAEWQTYVADLRAVIQSISSVLPIQPAYPAGT